MEFGIGARRHKRFYDGATRWSKKIKDRLSRLDTIPAVTDRRTERRTRCRSKDPAYYVARVKTAICFYPHDVVSGVLATATCLAGWLGGWLAGCPSHAGIVSKRLNLSENFFGHLKAPSF